MQKQNFMSNLFNDLQIRHTALIKLTVLVLAILLCGTLDAPAQGKRFVKKRSIKTAAKNIQPNNADKTGNTSTTPNNSNIPVTIVNSAETDFLSGEASVVVNPKQPTILRLGLAQNAVSIVEFPASDGIYYIHEGNPKLVSVFQSPTRETDRSITIYPGEGFIAGRAADGGGANPSATITLQMRSGLVLVLEFVPVASLSKNAHRCVINYNRDEVISARRTAGLAYNLGEDVKTTNQRNTRANSKLVSAGGGDSSEDKADETETDSETLPVRLASLEIRRGQISRRSDEKSTKQPISGLELSRLVNKRLAECLKNPQKNLGAWSKSNLGLSLAVSKVSEIDAEQRLLIVAVKSDAAANLRLVKGVPELQIQTADEKGNALQTERIERIYVETTSFEGLIIPGATVYYAIVYRAPVMGANQRLMVLASHREAADTPSTIILPNVSDTKE